MSNNIKIKRGLKAGLPNLEVGEFGLATDTNEVFIGTPTGNELVNGGGGGGDLNEMAYFNYAGNIYGAKNNLLANAWQDMKDSESVLFDIPLALAAPNQDMGGMTIDLYVGTNGQLQALYDACVNEVIPLPSSGNLGDIYLINNVAVKYYGEISGDIGFPIPLFEFGSMDDVNGFLIGDLTPLGMGLGITLAKITSVTIPNNKLTIQQGFDFEEPSGIILPDSVISIDNAAFYSWQSNNQPLVIPNSVTSIGDRAFYNWLANNQPLVIPNSITSIGNYAFANWSANNQPLVIPNSVTSIGEGAFQNWTSNNQPLVIPNSVTSIGQYAFRGWEANNQPLVIPDSVTDIGDGAFIYWSKATAFIMKPTIPPTITASTFYGTNNAPIYVPDESVTAYKTATNWVSLASRIFPISDRAVLTKSKIETALVGSGANSIQLGRSTSVSGSNAIAIGPFSTTSANSTTALGQRSKASVMGATALGANAEATNVSTIAVGEYAKASGFNSTVLGSSAKAEGNESTALGFNAQTGASNKLMRLGNTNLSTLESEVQLTVTSDIRDKADIEEVPKALDFIKDLNPITYVGNNRDNYISEEQKETDTYRNYLMVEDYDKQSHSQGTKKGERRRVGLSAQEVREKLIEHYGSDNYANVVNDNFVEFEERGLDIPEGLENKLSMSYETMVPFLIKAIQEQQEQIEELKKIINKE